MPRVWKLEQLELNPVRSTRQCMHLQGGPNNGCPVLFLG